MNTQTTAVKFNKFHVTNGVDKARVFYSIGNRTDGRACVTLYAKDYDRKLGRIIADAYQNDTDISCDLHDQGRVVLFENHPLYASALARAKAV